MSASRSTRWLVGRPCFEITVTQPDGGKSLLGAQKLWFTAKGLLGDGDEQALIRKSTASGEGIVITDAQQGKATLLIDSADTASIAQETELFFDLQLKDAEGAIVTLARSGVDGTPKLRVLLDVTRESD